MKFFTTIFTIIIMFGCAVHDDFDESSLKEEAEEFSLEIIHTYFDNDQSKFESFLTSTIYWMESNEAPISTSEFSVEDLFSIFDYSEYSIDDFYNTYLYEIQTYSDYSNDQ